MASITWLSFFVYIRGVHYIMMVIRKVVLFSALLVFSCSDQETPINKAQLSFETLSFVPKGYDILRETIFDLNGDGIQDAILILKKIGEEETSDVRKFTEKRPLKILFGNASNTYSLSDENDKIVYCFDCGGIMGDPFVDVIAKEGMFTIQHYGGSAWRWSRNVSFKYDEKTEKWYLYEDARDSFHSTEPNKLTTKITNQKDFGNVAFGSFNIYKN